MVIENFSFEIVPKKDVLILNLIKELPWNKATLSNDIPVSVLKDYIYCIRNGNFPKIIKKSEVTPLFKKGDPATKPDYRPVSPLSNFSKIVQKLIYV